MSGGTSTCAVRHRMRGTGQTPSHATGRAHARSCTWAIAFVDFKADLAKPSLAASSWFTFTHEWRRGIWSNCQRLVCHYLVVYTNLVGFSIVYDELLMWSQCLAVYTLPILLVFYDEWIIEVRFLKLCQSLFPQYSDNIRRKICQSL